MGALSRRKGHDFERRVARIYRAKWPQATVRRALQSEQAYESDVVIEGAAPMVAKRLWTECETGRACNPVRKMRQAVRDLERLQALSRIPVVVWRRHGSPALRATLTYGAVHEITSGEGFAVDRDGLLVDVSLPELLAMMPGWP